MEKYREMISITADRSDKKKRKIKIWAVVFWLLVWQGVSQVLGQEILLVSPVSVLGRLLELAVTADFWSSIAFSIIRIMGGFLLAAFLGILLGALAAGVPPVRQLLEPAVLTIKSIPVASFVILVLIWVSSENLSVVISFLMVFPVIYTNVLNGIESTDRKLLEMAEMQCGSRPLLESGSSCRSHRYTGRFYRRTALYGKSLSEYAGPVCMDHSDRFDQPDF